MSADKLGEPLNGADIRALAAKEKTDTMKTDTIMTGQSEAREATFTHLRMRIASLEAQLAERAWRPIETAPSSGTLIIVADEYGCVDVCAADGEYWRSNKKCTLRGWQPLPPPPITQGNATTGVEQEETPDERS